MEYKTIEVWTDGSCNNNPKHKNCGYAGWSFCVVVNGKKISEDLGYFENATSQTAEMTAVIKALIFTKNNFKKQNINIMSDSAYIVNCINELWYMRWIEMNWDDVKNSDLWKKLIKLYKENNNKVKFVKVKGHSGVKFNERADLLAGEARKYLLEIKGIL